MAFKYIQRFTIRNKIIGSYTFQHRYSTLSLRRWTFDTHTAPTNTACTVHRRMASSMAAERAIIESLGNVYAAWNTNRRTYKYNKLSLNSCFFVECIERTLVYYIMLWLFLKNIDCLMLDLDLTLHITTRGYLIYDDGFSSCSRPPSI